MAGYKYPRIVEFVDALPMTATGKILKRELVSRGRGGQFHRLGGETVAFVEKFYDTSAKFHRPGGETVSRR